MKRLPIVVVESLHEEYDDGHVPEEEQCEHHVVFQRDLVPSHELFALVDVARHEDGHHNDADGEASKDAETHVLGLLGFPAVGAVRSASYFELIVELLIEAVVFVTLLVDICRIIAYVGGFVEQEVRLFQHLLQLL